MSHIVIIGNGISGISAARHIRKWSDHRITVISAESDYFFSRTALMYIYMGHMKFEHTKPYEDWFWGKNRIELKRAYVEGIDAAAKRVLLSTEESFSYDKLIIASGSVSNKFDWPGQDIKGVQGLYSLQDLETMEKYTVGIRHAVIVGGGLIGIEMAEMLNSRGIPVTFLVREKNFWDEALPAEEARLVSRHILRHGIDLRLETELSALLPDGNGRVRAARTSRGEEISCQFAGLTAGVHPNIGFLAGSSIETGRGVLVNDYMETNIPGIFAIGDCAEFRQPLPGRKPVEQIWYTGRIMGETLARSICQGPVPYQPGNWFNSAKFFDIEYQTYGQVDTVLPDNKKSFYWEHPGGEKSLRINYDANKGHVLGCNVLGIRMRHEVWDKWISNKVTVDEVMAKLPLANFDPEFFPRHEKEIVGRYNLETGKNIKIKARKGLYALLQG